MLRLFTLLLFIGRSSFSLFRNLAVFNNFAMEVRCALKFSIPILAYTWLERVRESPLMSLCRYISCTVAIVKRFLWYCTFPMLSLSAMFPLFKVSIQLFWGSARPFAAFLECVCWPLHYIFTWNHASLRKLCIPDRSWPGTDKVFSAQIVVVRGISCLLWRVVSSGSDST